MVKKPEIKLKSLITEMKFSQNKAGRMETWTNTDVETLHIVNHRTVTRNVTTQNGSRSSPYWFEK